ncbi:uncharacterized protein J3D65DRAFT_35194 [Phyllosticta citribraziliensis]|uniref:Uncharacterized protein n=1 Tax=Phyllosticta citribraziliensis TaxID=989973 RepID=A0ABR1MBV7_9PEZI
MWIGHNPSAAVSSADDSDFQGRPSSGTRSKLGNRTKTCMTVGVYRMSEYTSDSNYHSITHLLQPPTSFVPHSKSNQHSYLKTQSSCNSSPSSPSSPPRPSLALSTRSARPETALAPAAASPTRAHCNAQCYDPSIWICNNGQLAAGATGTPIGTPLATPGTPLATPYATPYPTPALNFGTAPIGTPVGTPPVGTPPAGTPPFGTPGAFPTPTPGAGFGGY